MKELRLVHFQHLPLGQNFLYTMTLLVLGLGYMFALIHVWDSHAGRDGEPMLSVNDLIIAYSGSQTATRLESALQGPMQGMLPGDERTKIIGWVRAGTDPGEYESTIKPIIEKRCVMCHGPNPHIPKLGTYSEVKSLAERDTGMNLVTLVRVSHIHLFGITFIFFIMASIFVHANVRPLWFKCATIITPFLSIILDIGSWYLTKLAAPFAWMVIISGAFMGASFAIMWVTSMYQMWFYKLPEEIAGAGGELPKMGD